MSHRRKQALGKGLGALLVSPANRPPDSPEEVAAAESHSVMREFDTAPSVAADQPPGMVPTPEIPLALISPNPRQPRTAFDDEKLEELSLSIRQNGVLQPVLVTPDDTDPTRFILLAGERRLRAAERAGLTAIPARVIETTDAQRLEIAIIENVQRDDLNPVDEARAYASLGNSFGYSQEVIALKVGKSRVAVANSLRLLRLPDACLRDLSSGALTAGHARAILMLAHPLQQEQLRREVVEKGLSVREAEQRAREIPLGPTDTGEPSARKSKPPKENSLDVVRLEEKLTLQFGCKVRIREHSTTSGTIQIPYRTLDDLDRLLEMWEIPKD